MVLDNPSKSPTPDHTIRPIHELSLSSLSLFFFGNPATTRLYESRIHSFIKSFGRLASIYTVFQCILFIWYPAMTIPGYSSRSSIAFAGSHLRLMLSNSSISQIEKILPITLKQSVFSSNGRSSVAPEKERQKLR